MPETEVSPAELPSDSVPWVTLRVAVSAVTGVVRLAPASETEMALLLAVERASGMSSLVVWAGGTVRSGASTEPRAICRSNSFGW